MRKVLPAVLLFGVLLAARGAAQDDAVTLKVVKYDALKEEVLRHRGKVLVVDLWQDSCIPCKRNMPDLVKLAQTNAAKGLAVFTVSVDDVREDPAVKDRLLKFLTKQNATFTNLLVD